MHTDISLLKAEAKAMKLVYTSDHTPGYTRQRHGKVFKYYDTKGIEITDVEEQLRIKHLVLPPAWEQVWICAKANGHLQATGCGYRRPQAIQISPAVVAHTAMSISITAWAISQRRCR